MRRRCDSGWSVPKESQGMTPLEKLCLEKAMTPLEKAMEAALSELAQVLDNHATELMRFYLPQPHSNPVCVPVGIAAGLVAGAMAVFISRKTGLASPDARHLAALLLHVQADVLEKFASEEEAMAEKEKQGLSS